MKILKKSELRRRKQVERTNTECKILAAVRHPYIVCLHYAFQSPTKLYMVMDFIQVPYNVVCFDRCMYVIILCMVLDSPNEVM